MVERISWKQLNNAVIGQYHIQRLLDQHAWGPVFLAEDDSHQSYTLRFIGMPVPSETGELAPDQRLVYLGRFQQAANQLATLHHAHIMPLLDYGTYQNTPYLVYPFHRLTSLRSQLKITPQFDPMTAGRLLEQMGDALGYAQGQGILHGNLSTLSVFTRSDGRLLIAEMGLLHLRELYKRFFPLATGALFDGTSEASAPEQWMNRPIDASTDIYALGAILYRLLTNHAPFEGNSRAEVMEMHLSIEPRALKIWRSDLPSALNAVLIRALEKEPRARFQYPRELVEAYWQVISPGDAARVRAARMAQSSMPPRPEPATGGRITTPRIAATPPLPSAHSAKMAAVPPLPPAHSAKMAAMPYQRPAEPPKPSRRRLITLLATGGAGAVALFAALEFALSHQQATTTSARGPQGTPAHSGTVLAHTADLPVNTAKTFPLKGQDNPGILIHLPNKSFVAFDSTCTHQGCSVSYSTANHLLNCPCHGAVFDPAKQAGVVHGPAQTPLTTVKISVNADGTITM